LVVPASGRAIVTVTGGMDNSTASNPGFMAFAMSGANTSAGNDATALNLIGNGFQKASGSFVLSGLTPGSTTFTAKYRTTGGTETFQNRYIWVLPLP
jgi:hypothetical protein